ncbi:MAG: PAS domain S-box protein [Pseudomonadota bacterium]
MTQSPTDDAFGTNSPAYFDASDAGALQTLLSTILASVPDAMIVIDESGRIVAFSAAAEAMFGYQAEDVRGKNVSCLMTDADRPHHDEYIGTYLKTGRRRIIGIGRVVKARLADNREIPVDLKIGEAKIGEHRLFTGYIRDLSEQQRAEHRLREMQAELTNFSRLSVVGTMASAMAHELNQPLTAVANYLEASRDLLQTPDENSVAMAQDALDGAAKQSVRAGRIIRRLRDYVSRGEISTRVVSLPPLVADAVMLAQSGPKAHARIIKALDPNLPDVMADPVQIQQVLVNLIRNADEAIGPRPNTAIEIRIHSRTDAEIVVEVADNGPGLPADREHLFRPFSSTKEMGMGFGLAICQTIVEAHGGEIWARENSPHGAVFGFTLPLAPPNTQT